MHTANENLHPLFFNLSLINIDVIYWSAQIDDIQLPSCCIPICGIRTEKGNVKVNYYG
jgi:hypothetical protein